MNKKIRTLIHCDVSVDKMLCVEVENNTRYTVNIYFLKDVLSFKIAKKNNNLHKNKIVE